MEKPRPCGCKGCRTCLVCETNYGARESNFEQNLDRTKSYVYCPECAAAWTGWDFPGIISQHPNHVGEKIPYTGVYLQNDFLTEEEEAELVKNLDEMPWDTSQSGRRKQNFGPKTNFKKRKLVLGTFAGFPEFSRFIQERFDDIPLLKNYNTIEQCSLEYTKEKGASIDPHIDDCWIWGERIVTVNCLSDSVLTMIPFKGDRTKYNLIDAGSYAPVVNSDGSVNTDFTSIDTNALQNCLSNEVLPDIIVRIPMPRRSLLVIYGNPRYYWEHAVLRSDIQNRRVCIAYREFTPPYLMNGRHEDKGREVLSKSRLFWDHRERYKLIQV